MGRWFSYFSAIINVAIPRFLMRNKFSSFVLRVHILLFYPFLVLVSISLSFMTLFPSCSREVFQPWVCLLFPYEFFLCCYLLTVHLLFGCYRSSYFRWRHNSFNHTWISLQHTQISLQHTSISLHHWIWFPFNPFICYYTLSQDVIFLCVSIISNLIWLYSHSMLSILGNNYVSLGGLYVQFIILSPSS